MARKLLQEMSWTDAREAFKETRLAVVPVGSVEQHGSHLPLGTDFMIAEYLGRRAGLELGAIVTPVIPIGFAAYHSDFEGSLSVSKETLADYVREFCSYLVKYGTTHIIFINGHGGNLNSLDTVGRYFRDQGIAVATVMWWDVSPGLNAAWSPNGHGDAVEASMVMAIAPDAVYLDRAKLPVNKKLTPDIQILDGSNCQFGKGHVKVALRMGDVSDTGNMLEYGLNATADYTISPAQASAEEGRKLLDALVSYIVEFGKEFQKVSFQPVKP